MSLKGPGETFAAVICSARDADNAARQDRRKHPVARNVIAANRVDLCVKTFAGAANPALLMQAETRRGERLLAAGGEETPLERMGA